MYGPFQEEQYRLHPDATLPKKFHELAIALITRKLTPVRIEQPPAPRIDRNTGEQLPDLPRTTLWLVETCDGSGKTQDRLLAESQLRRELKSLIKWLCRVKLNSKSSTSRPLYRG